MNQELNEKLIEFINKIAENVFTVEFVVSIAGVLMNIPHVFILCQSSMRTCSTNALMIGIALCDLTFLLQVVYERVNQYWLSPSDNLCINSNTYYHLFFLLIGDFLRETCEKASFWIGVFLSLTRLFIMKLPGSTKIISKPVTGFMMVLLVLAITTLLSSYYYTKWSIVKWSDSWKPGKKCKGFPVNYIEPSYYRVFQEGYDLLEIVETHVMISGISRILISVIYPVLAVLLIFEIRKSAKFAAATLSKKSSLERHRTGRMILVMTVFYVIASAPGGASDFVQLFVQIKPNSILETLVGYGSIFISALFCFNATSHCLINFTMSSKYRNTVKFVLGIRKKETRVSSVTITKSSSHH